MLKHILMKLKCVITIHINIILFSAALTIGARSNWAGSGSVPELPRSSLQHPWERPLALGWNASVPAHCLPQEAGWFTFGQSPISSYTKAMLFKEGNVQQEKHE